MSRATFVAMAIAVMSQSAVNKDRSRLSQGCAHNQTAWCGGYMENSGITLHTEQQSHSILCKLSWFFHHLKTLLFLHRHLTLALHSFYGLQRVQWGTKNDRRSRKRLKFLPEPPLSNHPMLSYRDMRLQNIQILKKTPLFIDQTIQ